MAAPSKDAIFRMEWADFAVHLVAEGAGGNPDVMDDLARRGRDAFKDGIQALVESGLLDLAEIEDEE
jgi:hypothetical protein